MPFHLKSDEKQEANNQLTETLTIQFFIDVITAIASWQRQDAII